MNIAVLIPCLNEEATIKKVINDFQKALPESIIYVYDNNSSDTTFKTAKKAGALVRKEYNKGKANVVLRMFYEIEADIYIMVDGDDTYPADTITDMIQTFKEFNCDMLVGDRISSGAYKTENKRLFHGIGNALIKNLINRVFNSHVKDVLSGYRIFNRRFVKNYASSIQGFELETDLTLFSLNYGFILKEYPIEYRDRPENSLSKLHTFKDGIKVLRLFFNLYRLYKPMYFFGLMASFFLITGLILGYFPIREYIVNSNHYITKVPTAILAVSLVIISLLLFCCGLILDNLSKYDKRNFKQLLLNSK